MATNEFYHIVIPDDPLRLDQVIAKNLTELSRTKIQTLIKNGAVKVNGTITNECKLKIQSDDIIQMTYTESSDLSWQPYALDLNILFEDEHILVLDKPAGLVMHPGAAKEHNTIANALLDRYSEAVFIPRAGIVHRLDKDTSGVCICAKTNLAYLKLTKAIKDRKISRKYKAIVHGEIFAPGFVDQNIGRNPRHRTAMAVIENGRTALTHYNILEKFENFTWLGLELHTGRTHQIRVHMAYIGHPIVGDQLYNKPIHNYSNITLETIDSVKKLNRQALHAAEISFRHPITGETMSFSAKTPDDIKDVKATFVKKTF